MDLRVSKQLKREEGEDGGDGDAVEGKGPTVDPLPPYPEDKQTTHGGGG